MVLVFDTQNLSRDGVLLVQALRTHPRKRPESRKNVLDRQRWQTRDQLRLAIVIWIEKTYHRRRRQDTLGRMTPIEYETVTQTAHAASLHLPNRVNQSLGSPER